MDITLSGRSGWEHAFPLPDERRERVFADHKDAERARRWDRVLPSVLSHATVSTEKKWELHSADSHHIMGLNGGRDRRLGRLVEPNLNGSFSTCLLIALCRILPGTN